MKSLKKPSPVNVLLFALIFSGPIAVFDYVAIPLVGYIGWYLVGSIVFTWLMAAKKSDLFGRLRVKVIGADGKERIIYNWFWIVWPLLLIICALIIIKLYSEL